MIFFPNKIFLDIKIIFHVFEKYKYLCTSKNVFLVKEIKYAKHSILFHCPHILLIPNHTHRTVANPKRHDWHHVSLNLPLSSELEGQN